VSDFASVKKSARARVLMLLSDLEWHGFEELHRVGGVRYSARLLELKRLGYDIATEGKREHGLRYRLRSPLRGEPQQKRVKVFLREVDARILISSAIDLGLSEARSALQTAVSSFEANREKL
jgi:hypothetical protein